MIRSTAILRYANALALAAFLFAAVGAHLLHPLFHPHRTFHEDCLQKSADQETIPYRAEACFNLKIKCLICEFLSCTKTRCVANYTTVAMGGGVFGFHQQPGSFLPRKLNASPFCTRAPPFSTFS